MARRVKQRQCPRCGNWWPGHEQFCPQDGADMVRHRFRMDRARIARVHVLALKQKGMDYDDYKRRLKAITGRDSSKDLKQHEYRAFLRDLAGLPDAPGHTPRACA